MLSPWYDLTMLWYYNLSDGVPLANWMIGGLHVFVTWHSDGVIVGEYGKEGVNIVSESQYRQAGQYMYVVLPNG